MTAEVLAEIRRICAEDLELERIPAPGDEIAADLQLDSVAVLTLVVGLEDRFRVKLDDGDAANVRTVADLARLVADRAGAPAEEVTT